MRFDKKPKYKRMKKNWELVLTMFVNITNVFAHDEF